MEKQLKPLRQGTDHGAAEHLLLNACLCGAETQGVLLLSHTDLSVCSRVHGSKGFLEGEVKRDARSVAEGDGRKEECVRIGGGDD